MQPARRVLTVLAGKGLLLKQDETLPNVVGILTGASLAADVRVQDLS